MWQHFCHIVLDKSKVNALKCMTNFQGAGHLTWNDEVLIYAGDMLRRYAPSCDIS